MKQRLAVAALICAAGAIGLIAAVPRPVATLDASKISVGEVWQGQQIQAAFQLTNSGRGTLILDGVEATCACTRAEADQSSLAPGEHTTVRVGIDSSLLSGHLEKTVAVRTNDPLRSRIELTILGAIKEEFRVEAPAVFAMTESGDRLSARLRIQSVAQARVLAAESTDKKLRFDVSYSGSEAVVDAVASSAGMRDGFIGMAILKTSSAFMPEIRVPITAVRR